MMFGTVMVGYYANYYMVTAYLVQIASIIVSGLIAGFGNLFLFIIGAILGIAFVCELAKNLERNKLLGWYGKNSIIIYVLYFGMIKVLHYIGKTIFPSIAQSNYSYPYNCCYFIVIVLLMLPIGKLCNMYVPFLFGKCARK